MYGEPGRYSVPAIRTRRLPPSGVVPSARALTFELTDDLHVRLGRLAVQGTRAGS
jgi:hypothetical protein